MTDRDVSAPPLIRPPRRDERRSPERIQAHYVLERALAKRLRGAGKEERKGLYSSVYDELFRSVPELTSGAREDAERRAAFVARSAARLGQFLTPHSTFLEIGPGDLALASRIASSVAHVYAVDVSSEVTRHETLPANVAVILSDGSSIPVGANSVDLAFSNQVMEHLHPDDALDQLRNVLRAIKPGGRYVCITPSSIAGPHDISMYFSAEPTGLHLKEYTTTELVGLFRAAGFSRVSALVPTPLVNRFLVVPTVLVTSIEWILWRLPRGTARVLAGSPVLSPLLSRVVGTK